MASLFIFNLRRVTCFAGGLCSSAAALLLHGVGQGPQPETERNVSGLHLIGSVILVVFSYWFSNQSFLLLVLTSF
jgi:hypothetical protein